MPHFITSLSFPQLALVFGAFLLGLVGGLAYEDHGNSRSR